MSKRHNTSSVGPITLPVVGVSQVSVFSKYSFIKLLEGRILKTKILAQFLSHVQFL